MKLLPKDDQKLNQIRLVRAIKTIFFLLTLLVSLLLFSAAPVFLAIADTILLSALLSISPAAAASPHLSLECLLFNLSNYDFQHSIVDIPLISVLRSIIILWVYCCCNGPGKSRGPYLGAATVCSVVSLVFVSVKAWFVFGQGDVGSLRDMMCRGQVELAAFVCSYVVALGHVAVAYRIRCRERKKLFVYKIDIEAVIKSYSPPNCPVICHYH